VAHRLAIKYHTQYKRSVPSSSFMEVIYTTMFFFVKPLSHAYQFCLHLQVRNESCAGPRLDHYLVVVVTDYMLSMLSIWRDTDSCASAPALYPSSVLL
jgi:hypothetical protein